MCIAIFIANVVLPTPGRAAKIIKLESINPASFCLEMQNLLEYPRFAAIFHNFLKSFKAFCQYFTKRHKVTMQKAWDKAKISDSALLKFLNLSRVIKWFFNKLRSDRYERSFNVGVFNNICILFHISWSRYCINETCDVISSSYPLQISISFHLSWNRHHVYRLIFFFFKKGQEIAK